MFHSNIKLIMIKVISKLSCISLLLLVNSITVLGICHSANHAGTVKEPGNPIVSSDGCFALNVVEPKCEYTRNPLGIDVTQPRFSWVLKSSSRGQMQTAYQVLVASSEENLTAGIGDKWDSGKQESGQSVNVVYQ